MLARYASAVVLLISRAAEESRPAMAWRARLNADLSLDSLKAQLAPSTLGRLPLHEEPQQQRYFSREVGLWIVIAITPG